MNTYVYTLEKYLLLDKITLVLDFYWSFYWIIYYFYVLCLKLHINLQLCTLISFYKKIKFLYKESKHKFYI